MAGCLLTPLVQVLRMWKQKLLFAIHQSVDVLTLRFVGHWEVGYSHRNSGGLYRDYYKNLLWLFLAPQMRAKYCSMKGLVEIVFRILV